MPVHWTRTLHCFGEAETGRDEVATPAPPLCRGDPAGGMFLRDLASLELYLYYYYNVGPCFEGNWVVG